MQAGLLLLNAAPPHGNEKARAGNTRKRLWLAKFSAPHRLHKEASFIH